MFSIGLLFLSLPDGFPVAIRFGLPFLVQSFRQLMWFGRTIRPPSHHIGPFDYSDLCWSFLVGSPFGALPFIKRPPQLFMCLLALCRLGCSLRPFELFARPDSAPPRNGSAAPGHNPARGPCLSSLLMVRVRLSDPPAPFGLLLHQFGTRPGLIAPRAVWTI